MSIEASAGDTLVLHEVRDQDLAKSNLNISGISAPVFDASAKMTCSLALTAFSTMLNGRQIREMGAALKASADRITDQLQGRRPETAAY